MVIRNFDPERLEGGQTSDELLRIVEKYEDKTETIKKPEREKFLERAREWERKNDIETIRKAGITKEQNEKDPLQKHALLSSAYLEKIGDAEYRVDFRGNDLAEWKVGAGDVFPPNIGTIEVNGKRAVRAINPATNRIGYYDKAFLEQNDVYDYVPIFSGDVVKVIEAKEYNHPAVQSKQKRENLVLYELGGAQAVEGAEKSPAELREETSNKIRQKKERKVKKTTRETREKFNQLLPAEVAAQRQRLVSVAESYLKPRKGNYFQERYYNPSVDKENIYKGGKLGCAIVSTTMLREAGNIAFTNPGVNATETQLRQKGWTPTPWRRGIEKPGDVIIWRVKGADGKERRRHIGIIVGPNEVVHNQYRKGTARPRKTGISSRLPHGGSITVWRQPGFEKPKAPERREATAEQISERELLPSARKVPFTAAQVERAVGRWTPFIEEASRKYNLPVNFIKAVMFTESKGNARIVSHAGAGGLMQLMPATAKHMLGKSAVNLSRLKGDKLESAIAEARAKGKYLILPFKTVGGKRRLDSRDVRINPNMNIDMGVRYISRQYKKYKGDIYKTLASYNWGPGAVKHYLAGTSEKYSRVPKETRDYMRIIPTIIQRLDAANA